MLETTIILRSAEPCDIHVVARKGKLFALIVESTVRYAILLGETTFGDFAVVSDQHHFDHTEIPISIVDDFALVAGLACYNRELTDDEEEVILREISNS